MGKLATNFRLGKKLEGDAGEVQKSLEDTYQKMAPIINRKADMIVTDRVPTTDDRNFNIGTFWFRYTTNNLWILGNNNPVTWGVII